MAINWSNAVNYMNEAGDSMKMAYDGVHDEMTVMYVEEGGWSACGIELNREWAYALRDFINDNFGEEQ